MKRKYALAAALVGALVLPLCSCGGSAEAIKREAYEYLASRYSARPFQILCKLKKLT